MTPLPHAHWSALCCHRRGWCSIISHLQQLRLATAASRVCAGPGQHFKKENSAAVINTPWKSMPQRQPHLLRLILAPPEPSRLRILNPQPARADALNAASLCFPTVEGTRLAATFHKQDARTAYGDCIPVAAQVLRKTRRCWRSPGNRDRVHRSRSNPSLILLCSTA